MEFLAATGRERPEEQFRALLAEAELDLKPLEFRFSSNFQ